MKIIIFYVGLKIKFVIASHNLKAIEVEVFVDMESNNYFMLNEELLLKGSFICINNKQNRKSLTPLHSK